MCGFLDIKTGVLPNDDLDLQLIWLLAAEKHGKAVNAPMDFTVCAEEMKDGFCELLLELSVAGRPTRVYIPIILLKKQKSNNGLQTEE